jgi:hypothetical protein
MSIFGKRSIRNELEPPPMATEHPEALELMRLWASTSGPQQITMKKGWDDPGAWGITLVDIARHAANLYAKEGHDYQEVLDRIRSLFDAEWESPTSPAEDLTPN